MADVLNEHDFSFAEPNRQNSLGSLIALDPAGLEMIREESKNSQLDDMLLSDNEEESEVPTKQTDDSR